ncbi:MAG: sulfatase-like hydrolase/transferase [Deltaproteobacteria bacterium]|nr:sulfatase-like hydrolase/transferase [Deltaproteobacteria bacterium]
MTDQLPRIIYWFCLSSLRSDLIGLDCRGQAVMPALRALSQESFCFERAYCQSAQAVISAASALTGLWPTRLGVKDCPLEVSGQGLVQAFGLDSGFATLAQRLTEEGYETFSLPESLFPGPGDGLGRGFAHLDRLPGRLAEDQRIFVFNHAPGPQAPFEPSNLALDQLGLKPRADFDQTGRGRLSGPVNEAQAAELKELYLAAAFDADRRLARTVEDLKQAGLWDEALVIVLADRGQELLEHGAGLLGGQLYDETLRVPLLIKFPQLSPLAAFHGQKSASRVRLIDLVPTLAELVQAEPFPDLDGASLVPVIKGQEAEPLARPVLAQASTLASRHGQPVIYESLAVILGQFKALTGYRAADSQQPAEFDYMAGDEIREFFDLEQDPGERTNLYPDHKDDFQALLAEAGPALAPLAGADQEPDEDRERLAERLRSLGYI